MKEEEQWRTEIIESVHKIQRVDNVIFRNE